MKCFDHKTRFQQQQKSISYNVALWVAFIACLLITVIDRLTLNVWPLGVNHTFPHEAVWGVQVFEVFSWISGRMSIVTTSILFLTQCRTTMNILVDICPKWLYIGDIRRINDTIHIFAGWMTAIIILLHVWLIFLGPLTSGTSLMFLESQSMRSQVPFYDAEKEILALAPDDVWRLIEMSVLFLILFPLSMWSKAYFCRKQRYTTAMIIHLIAALMFAVDIIRKKSHPHSKVFNIPVVVYWGLDRMAGMFLYRKCQANVTSFIDFDDGRCVLLFLKVDPKLRGKSGGALYLHFQKLSMRLFGYAHPFTMWTNQGVLQGIEDRTVPKIACSETDQPDAVTKRYEWSRCISVLSKRALNEKGKEELVIDVADGRTANYAIPDYDYACIIKIMEGNGVPTCTQRLFQNMHESVKPQEVPTWTQRLYKDLRESLKSQEEYALDFYGPYHTLFHNLRVPASELPAMVFIGSGCGASPLIDFHQYITHNQIQLERPVVMLYTCNSPHLFEFVASILMNHHIDNFSCKGWVTQFKTDQITHVHETLSNERGHKANPMKGSRRIEKVNCRVSISDELQKAKDTLNCTDVFFCGNANIEKEIQGICKTMGLAMNLGHCVG